VLENLSSLIPILLGGIGITPNETSQSRKALAGGSDRSDRGMLVDICDSRGGGNRCLGGGSSEDKVSARGKGASRRNRSK
jgi:hypothetical protein